MKNLCSPRNAHRTNWRMLAAIATFLLLLLSAGVTVFMQNLGGGGDHLARRRSATTDVSSPVKVRSGAATSVNPERIPLNLAPEATIVPPSGCPNVMNDPTFEAGSPWPAWNIQTSTNFGNSMCAAPGCNINGGQTAPYSGRNWLWFGGGTGDLAEVSTQGQTLTVPTGKAAFLRFRMKIQQVLTPFTDTVQVKVDGTSLQTFTEPATGELDYTERVVDVSAFANGASHTVVLEYNSSDGNSNFLIDDVFLEVCNSAPSVNQPTTNGIVNSNFETGAPYAPWTHTSTVFGSPMCDVDGCGVGVGGPFSGENWAWMGGYAAATAGTDIVSQSVTIPAGARAILRFRLRIGQVSSPFTDSFKVKVDGNTMLTITEPTTADATYFARSVNLSQFANGAAHTILFEYTGVGGGTATFNLDDPVLEIAQGGQNFVATLSGDQEVPPTGSMASGVGLVTLNAAENQITVSMDYVGLGTPATLSHIHGNATSTPGNTAPVIFDFGAVSGTSGSFSGLTFAITPAQVALLRQGLLYFNVHTSTFPNGEIRGQIHPTEMSANFDGDGKTDAAVFRPGNTIWYSLRSSDNTFRSPQWGLNTDVLTPGDYDGDARADVAVFRNGTWFIRRSSDDGLTAQVWGFGTDIPVPGDYDKDGKTDVAVFRPSAGFWYILKSSNNQLQAQPWGASTDKPVPGDYDRDGKTDLAVFRPDDQIPGAGAWYILNSSDGSFTHRQFGFNTDKLVPADYNGDGKTDIAVWRPSEGTWYVSTGPGPTDFTSQVWGLSTDIPVPGDYDSDAKADLAVFRPSEGRWYVLRSLNNTLQILYWGANGDTPVPSIYVK